MTSLGIGVNPESAHSLTSSGELIDVKLTPRA
jgi:hypothetical protein